MAAVLLGSAPAGALVIDCGPTICYQYQESQSAVAIFGLPLRIGDALQFLPPAAVAHSGGSPGPSSLAATFVIERIYSSAGPLARVAVSAEGDYDATAAATVGASLDLQAFNNEGPGAGAARAVFSATGSGEPAQAWGLDAAIEPAAAFATPSADIRLELSKLLAAVAAAGEGQAWTSAKYVVVNATAVPLPPALGLLGTAAAAVALRARRRGAASA